MREFVKQFPVLNRLLSSLPHAEYEHLLPKLEQVHMPKGKILYHAGDTVRHAYFINSGMVSLLSTTADGATVEVGMVGNEGAVGLPVILRTNTTPYQVMVQIAVGSALRIRSDALRNEFDRGGKLQDLLLRYTHVLLTQISQSAVCNRFHNSEERLGRWLLITNDLVKEDTFLLTHELIAHMLGTPRTGVTMAAGALQREGLIRYSRGKITILDRPALESAACECYQVIKEGFDHFLDVEQTPSPSR